MDSRGSVTLYFKGIHFGPLAVGANKHVALSLIPGSETAI